MAPYVNIGIISLANLGVLSCYTLWRTWRCVLAYKDVGFKGKSFRRKLALHIFLLLATVCDIPMAVSFVLLNEYDATTYSFHRFESALVFAAFSITIMDWSNVLFDIREETKGPLLTRRAFLYAANFINFSFSLVNFILAIDAKDMTTITTSKPYQIGEFLQVGLTFLVMVLLLHAGLKLSWRIQGATGSTSNTHRKRGSASNIFKYTGAQHGSITGPRDSGPSTGSGEYVPPNVGRNPLLAAASGQSAGTPNHDKDRIDAPAASASPFDPRKPPITGPTPDVTPQKSGPARDRTSTNMSNRSSTGAMASAFSVKFNNALNRLNTVMGICTACFVMQITMSGLNIILGYDTRPDSYVGGIYLYWTLYEWLPLWGTILSLLSLSRTAMKNHNTRASVAPIRGSSNANSPDPHEGQKGGRPITLDEESQQAEQSLLSEDGFEYDINEGPLYRSTAGASSGYYSSVYEPGDGDGDGDRDTGGYSEGSTMPDGRGYSNNLSGNSDNTKDIYSTPAVEGEARLPHTYYSDVTNTPMDMGRRLAGAGGVNNVDGVDEQADLQGDGYSTQSGETLNRASDMSMSGQSHSGLPMLRDTNDPQSMQFASELYNYDVQAAFQGGGYSYRMSTNSHK